MEKNNYNIDVLINGAGPTGLMMACQLALHNVSFRIIDKKVSSTAYSGALVIHARTLEYLHQMGLAVKFLRSGTISRKINLRFSNKMNLTLDVYGLGEDLSVFPHLLMLEQSKTEALLASFVEEKGFRIEKSTTLLSFTQKNGSVTSVLKTPKGMEKVISRFLIGAGGSTSIVRRQLQIPFYGKTYSPLLFVSDCRASVEAKHAEMSFIFSKSHTIGFFPLPGNRWRVDGAIPLLEKKYEEITFNTIKGYFAQNSGSRIRLHDPEWFSVFRSHSRYAPIFKKDNCFLIGDAAHIHSPVGSQGMNTGMQDACNLAWKLAFFIQGKAKKEILDTYQEERLPVAKSIIRYTDRAFQWVTYHNSFVVFARLYILPILLQLFLPLINNQKSIRRFVFKAISGIRINYRNSVLSASLSKDKFPWYAPQPGDRLPCLEYVADNKAYYIQEKVKYNAFRLFVFGVHQLPQNIQSILALYKDNVEVELVRRNQGSSRLFSKMGVEDTACYLVRPDLYIAWRCLGMDSEGLGLYLRKFLS